MGTPITYLSGGTMGYQSGVFKNATTALGFTFPLTSGYRWWNGVDTSSSQYLLYSDIHSVGQSTVANGRPTAWSTPDLTDQSLLNLINTLPERVGKGLFTSVYAALDWLQSTGTYFLIRNGLENIVQSNLLNYYDAGWYTSYAGTGTSWSDLSGNNRTATLNNGVTFNSSGVGTFVFDGANDYAQTTGGNFTNQATMSCWFRTTTTQTNTYLMAMAKNIGSGNNGIDLLLNPTEVGGYWVATSGSFAYITYSTSYADNQWHMFTIAADGSNLRLYYDGILRTTLSLSGTLDIEATRRLTIGSWANGGSNAFASIPIAQLYSVGLSAEQVYQNYNTQKGRFGITSPVQNGMILELDAANPTSYPGTGTAWTDISGYANNGTLTNGPTFSSSNGGSIVFDGSDDYVYIAPTSSTNISTTITAECWVYYSSGNGRIFQKDGEAYTRCWEMGGYGGTFRMEMWHSNGSGTLGYGNSLPVNGWTQLVLTFDGTDIKMYQDAILVTTINFPGDIRTDINTPLYVGGIWSTGEYFNGRISISRLYNVPLSAPQIVQNFYSLADRYGIGILRGGLVLNMDAGNFASYPTSGTTWYDLSGNVFDGVLTNGPTYSSGSGGYISLDGGDDYIESVTATDLGINLVSTSFTISVWFNTTGVSEYYLFDNYDGSNQDISLRIDGGKFEVYLIPSAGSGIDAVQFGSGYNNGAWHNFTLVWNGSNTVTAYADGVSLGTSTQSGMSGNFESGSAFRIGSRPASTSYFPGNIGQIQVYNRALTSGNVTTNFNAVKARYGL